MSGAGINGEQFPFLMGDSDWITGIMIGCFLMTAYVLATGKHMLWQHLRDFFYTRERENLFNQQTAGDVHCRLLLLLQTCLLSAVLYFRHYDAPYLTGGDTVQGVLQPLVLYILLMLGYCLFKWGIYNFINWIFFDRLKGALWIEAYFFILYTTGLLLWPLMLLVIYIDLSPFWTGIGTLSLFVLANLALLYKGFSIFFNNFHGIFYLIVYFCTLEIAPLLILWRGIITVHGIKI